MKAQWYRKRSMVVLMHAAVWLLFFLLPVLLRAPSQRRFGGEGGRPPDAVMAPPPGEEYRPGGAPGGPSGPPRQEARPDVFGWFNFFTDLWLILVFYVNTQMLVPVFFNRRRYGYFAASHVLLFGGLLTFNYVLFALFIGPPVHGWPGPLQFVLFPYLLVVAAAMVYRLFQDKLSEEHGRQERENENLKTELSLLRMQVSPHFMFNVLNNMVALARKRSQQLEPSLIKLSSLMRYMLYEADGKVPLEKEIEYLQNYIDLQRQRFEGPMAITVEEGPMDGSLEIEPMLLIPFVENAFKHGRDDMGEGSIQIRWRTVGGVLSFSVQNTFGAEVSDKTPGIGLVNVRRRLDLLYTDRYSLDIRSEGEWFFVFLQIKL